MVQECKAQGIKPAFVIAFNGPDTEEAAQVISDQDEKQVMLQNMKKNKVFEKLDQSGGNQLVGKMIVGADFWCPSKSFGKEYGKKQIDNAIKDGYEVIAFDWMGYKNYCACYCPECTARAEKYAKEHPEYSREEAVYKTAADLLVEFNNELTNYAKSKKKDIEVTCHLYPDLDQDPLYGNRINMDYPASTVSWFFNPHWDTLKVEKYVRDVVLAGKTPFLGIYTEGDWAAHKKTPEKLREDFKILKKYGAKSVSIAELQNILDDPETAKIVSEELGGDISKVNMEKK